MLRFHAYIVIYSYTIRWIRPRADIRIINMRFSLTNNH